MPELDVFETRFTAAYRRYLDEVPTAVDAAAIARRLAVAHPHRRAVLGFWPLVAVPRPALVLLLAGLLLAALLGTTLLVGAWRDAPISVVPPTSPSPSPAADEGTNVLATTRAHALPAAATCPPGTDPDAPGPAGQVRPVDELSGLLEHAMAFDRRAGRIVLLSEPLGTAPTWTFDVCTNTWQIISPSEPAAASFDPTTVWGSSSAWLAYDADSDRSVALVALSGGGPLQTWDYGLAANRWTRHDDAPVSNMKAGGYGVVYHDPSGLIVVFDGTDMWAYDVDADSWAAVRQRPDPALPVGAGLPDGFMALGYDPGPNVLVAYADPPDGRPTETWTFDPVSSTWRRVPGVTTPELRYGWFASGSAAAFHEELGQVVFAAGDGNLARYDAGLHAWTTLYDRSTEGLAGATGWCDSRTPVGDALNARVVCRGTGGGMAAFTATGRWRWLLEPEAGSSPAP
jgi:hypothetical protein